MHEIKTKKICCTTYKSTSQSEILWGKNVFQYIILTKRNILSLQQNFPYGNFTYAFTCENFTCEIYMWNWNTSHVKFSYVKCISHVKLSYVKHVSHVNFSHVKSISHTNPMCGIGTLHM